MDFTANIADFKLLSKQLQENGKIISIYDYFVPLLTKNFYP